MRNRTLTIYRPASVAGLPGAEHQLRRSLRSMTRPMLNRDPIIGRGIGFDGFAQLCILASFFWIVRFEAATSREITGMPDDANGDVRLF